MPNNQPALQNWRDYLTEPLSRDNYGRFLMGLQITFGLEPEYVLRLLKVVLKLKTQQVHQFLKDTSNEGILKVLSVPFPEAYCVDCIKAQVRAILVTTTKNTPTDAELNTAVSNFMEWTRGRKLDLQEINKLLITDPEFCQAMWDYVAADALSRS